MKSGKSNLSSHPLQANLKDTAQPKEIQFYNYDNTGHTGCFLDYFPFFNHGRLASTCASTCGVFGPTTITILCFFNFHFQSFTPVSGTPNSLLDTIFSIASAAFQTKYTTQTEYHFDVSTLTT
jgi:hypothetical protein